MKNKLITRWKTELLWRYKWETITKWIFSSKEIMDEDKILEFTMGNNLDFRGYSLKAGRDFSEYSDMEYEDILQESKGLISNKKFINIDFSYADFSGRYFEKCEFKNCVFKYTNMRNINEEECKFSNCYFFKGYYNASIGLGESFYENIEFDSISISGSLMFWPNFKNCIFKNVKLKGVDFGGAHFENVKFIGKVEDVWFRGKKEAYKKGRYWETKYERWNKINPMRVDFSDAVLSYITVSDYCDLSEVILPVDKSCYLINDIRKMRNYIENRLLESESDFLKLLLKLQISEKEGEKMSILCLNDLYNQIKKFIKKENQIDALKLWEEISTDLLKKNILSK